MRRSTMNIERVLGESRRRESIWLHKLENGIEVIKFHIREVWYGTCCDTSHERFRKLPNHKLGPYKRT